MFKREGEKELFQWGIAGQIPLMSLIGFIVRVQTNPCLEPEVCPEVSAVIAWDQATGIFKFFVHKDIPWDSLVGMLEAIKFTLISSQVARASANQQMILGPDGRPAGGNRPVIM
jgi:hypothetical protein